MSALHDGSVHPRLFAEVAVAMLEQPEDQKLEARLVLVAKDVLCPRKPSENAYVLVSSAVARAAVWRLSLGVKCEASSPPRPPTCW